MMKKLYAVKFKTDIYYYVVKARVKNAGYGEINRLARKLKLYRSNLSEIINENKQL